MELGRDGFSTEQCTVYEDLKTLSKDISDHALLKRLAKDDAGGVSTHEMKWLIHVFTTIFFPTTSLDAKMELAFEWKDWKNCPGDIGEYSDRGTGVGKISMRRFNYARNARSYGDLNHLVMDRLATILHELVHAYLNNYACRCVGNVGSYEEDVSQLEGHGRAWQRMASSIERACPDLIGLPLNLTRFTSIQCSWDELAYWPTQQEAKNWELGRNIAED
jgi:hypothetical protein